MKARTWCAVIALVLLTTAGCDWSMDGFDATRSGYNPFERDVGVSNVATLHEAWFQAKPPAFGSAASPIVTHGSLIAAVRYGLLAFDAVDGTPRWTATPGFETSRPAAGGDTVFVSATHTLYAYDAAGKAGCSNAVPATCDPMWIGSVSGTTVGSPAVANGQAFVATDTGAVFAYDTAPTDCPIVGPPAVCKFRWVAQSLQGAVHLSQPAVGNGRVFVSSTEGVIAAIPVSGSVGSSAQPEWTADVNPGEDAGPPDQRPTVAGGRLYVPWSDWVYVFDAAGVAGCAAGPPGSPRVCQPLFRFQQNYALGVAVANGRVYSAGTIEGSMNVYDAAGVTGCSGSPKVCQPLWSYAPVSGAAPPTVANGVVYVASGPNEEPTPLRTLAFDATGTVNCAGTPKTCAPLWTRTFDDAFANESPAVVNGMVYVAAPDGLHAYRTP